MEDSEEEDEFPYFLPTLRVGVLEELPCCSEDEEEDGAGATRLTGSWRVAPREVEAGGVKATLEGSER